MTKVEIISDTLCDSYGGERQTALQGKHAVDVQCD